MPNRYLFCISSFVLAYSPTYASCLDEVTSFAVGICGAIKSEGGDSDLKGTAELSLKANSILTRIIGSGSGSISGEAAKHTFDGPVREQLTVYNFNVLSCRREMVGIAVKQLCGISASTEKTSSQKNLPASEQRPTVKPPSFSRMVETLDGPNVTFGCNAGNTSSVTYSAPTGHHIVNANASVIDSRDAKSSAATVTSQSRTKATAVADFQGNDKEFFNCRAGGHGAVRITVEIAPD